MDGITKTILLIISTGVIFQSVNVIDYFYQAKVLFKYTVVIEHKKIEVNYEGFCGNLKENGFGVSKP